MGLSSRELLLILRLQDEASGALRSVATQLGVLGAASNPTANKLMNTGAALSQIGGMMTMVGGLGTSFFNGAIDGAMEYDHQAALAATQSKNVGVSFEQLKDIGMRVGKDIPVAWDKVQPTLYDIFSTINTDGAGAEQALRAFSTAAVAGGADVQDVARLSMAEMNVFGLGVGDLGHLLDSQFRLVQLGRGTYSEFASAMGKSIPTAKAAGQSLDTLSGMMAFLTRNGLSVAEATSSAGRAMEMLTGKKGQEGLQKLGISIYDSNGHVKQMNQLVTELGQNKGWSQMDEASRKRWFETIFGKGTIQARRFFDAAIPNYEQLNDLTNQMVDSQGALGEAYREVAKNDPTFRAKELENQYKALKQQIGDQLIPAKLKLMEVLGKILGAFTNLSPTTQKVIIAVLAGAAAFFTIVGPILMVVGSVMMIIGTFAALGVTLGGFLLTVGIVLVVLAALAAAAYLIYQNWDTIKPLLVEVWDAVKVGVQYAWEKLQDFWGWLQNTAWPIAQQVFDGIKEAAKSFWDKLVEIYNWFDQNFGPGIERVWTALRDNIPPLIDELIQTAQKFKDKWDEAWPIFVKIKDIIVEVFEFLKPYIETSMAFLKEVIIAAWNFVKNEVVDVWNFITRIISDAIAMVSNFIQFWLNIIQGDWGAAWDNVKNILRAAWDALGAIVRFGWETLKNLFWLGWNAVFALLRAIVTDAIRWGSDVMHGMWAGLTAGWSAVWNFTANIEQSIRNIFSGAASWLWNAGANILQGLLNGIESKVQALKNKLQSITSWIPSWKGPADVDKKLLFDNGSMIMHGLIMGLDSGMSEVKDYLQGQTVAANFTPAFASTGGSGGSNNDAMMAKIDELIDSIRNQKSGMHVENLTLGSAKDIPELDWWTRIRFAGN